MTISLPGEFFPLQPFADKWALATEYERAAERRRSTPGELRAFYDAGLPLLEAILERADRYPLGEIAGVDRQLFHIALSIAEVAPHVEFYGADPGVPFAFSEERMMGVHCDHPD